jgi:acyl-homoserine lactone acylase PvdQ
VALLDAEDKVTREEAIAYTVDVYDILAEPWQNALKTATQDKSLDGDVAKVVGDILAWDGHYTPDSKGTPFLKNWRLKCADAINVAAVAAGEPLSPEDNAKMIMLLEETIAEMKEQYGTIDVSWGDVHVVGRGGKYFPGTGADFGGSTDGFNFTETLFDVRYRQDSEDPKRHVANNGSMATLLMFFSEDGVESYSVVPWGQSGDPESPHYMDQGEQLYTQRKMKPTWWARASLEGHIKSEKVLTLP